MLVFQEIQTLSVQLMNCVVVKRSCRSENSIIVFGRLPKHFQICDIDLPVNSIRTQPLRNKEVESQRLQPILRRLSEYLQEGSHGTNLITVLKYNLITLGSIFSDDG